MGYRDARETRRAHVRRLEEELAALEREEALLRSLPRDADPMARLVGGPKTLTRRFVADGPVDVEAVAREIYDIDGRTARDGDAVVWRAEPEPRPRRVEIRATRVGDRTAVEITDKGSYRAYLALVGFAWAFVQGREWGAVGIVAGLLLMVLAALWLRREVLRMSRRRARQMMSVEEAAMRGPGMQARVALEPDEEEEAVEATASKARAAR